MRTLLLALLAMTTTAAADEVVNQPQSFEGQTAVSLDYLLTLPVDYDADASKQFPLVVFLHGAGERGDDLDLVKKHGPPKLVAAGKQFPFILAAPQCPEGRWWQPTEVLALIDHLEATQRVDPDRIILTGLSMGGYGTWDTAGLAADRFAAAVPVCGGGNGMAATMMGTLPIRAFHGADDPVVPVAASQYLANRINKKGGNVQLTVYPGVGHDSWTQTYDNPELYEWMMQQRRTARQP